MVSLKGAKVLSGGANDEQIISWIGIILSSCFIVYIIYMLYKLLQWLLTPRRPDKEYTKVLTVKKKRVKTQVHNYNEYKQIGEMTFVYPKSYNTYTYYFDGTDRNIYNISEFNYKRVEENETIEVDIAEYNGDPILYIRKIIKFEEPKELFGII